MRLNLVCCSPADEVVEPYFSRAACDYCGDQTAGDRYEVTGRLGHPSGPVYELAVCEDCFVFLCD